MSDPGRKWMANASHHQRRINLENIRNWTGLAQKTASANLHETIQATEAERKLQWIQHRMIRGTKVDQKSFVLFFFIIYRSLLCVTLGFFWLQLLDLVKIVTVLYWEKFIFYKDIQIISNGWEQVKCKRLGPQPSETNVKIKRLGVENDRDDPKERLHIRLDRYWKGLVYDYSERAGLRVACSLVGV